MRIKIIMFTKLLLFYYNKYFQLVNLVKNMIENYLKLNFFIKIINIALLISVLFCLGCGKKPTFPVSGAIQYKDSRKPAKDLEGYSITSLLVESYEDFENQKTNQVIGKGVIQGDGTFELKTSENEDLPNGRYLIAISPEPFELTPEGIKYPKKSKISLAYSNFWNSGLSITVEGKTSELILVKKQGDPDNKNSLTRIVGGYDGKDINEVIKVLKQMPFTLEGWLVFGFFGFLVFICIINFKDKSKPKQPFDFNAWLVRLIIILILTGFITIKRK